MKKTSILIVDDNISLAKSLCFIMEKKGFEVTMAEDGPEAIKKAGAKSFDIILMDIKMPLMNGVEAYRKIKKISPGTVVFVMTAYAVEELVQDALEEGAYSVLYKPLDIEKTIDLVEEALGNKKGICILIVDDDPSISKTLKKILEKKGFNIHIASSGEEAIAKYKKESFDIVFIDMKLPTINGLETYLELKNIKKDIIAIIMTAYREEVSDLVNSALKNSAYTCLYKPLDMEKILNILDRIREEGLPG